MLEEEDKFLEIRDKLKALPQVKAGGDFVNALQRKINEIEAEHSTALHKKNVEKMEEGFFSRLFGPAKNPWLIPASGFAVVLVLVFAWVFLIRNGNNGLLPNKEEAPQENVTQSPGTQSPVTETPELKEKQQVEGKDIASGDTRQNEEMNVREPVRVSDERSEILEDSKPPSDRKMDTDRFGVPETESTDNMKLNTNLDQEQPTAPVSKTQHSAMPKKDTDTARGIREESKEKKKMSSIKRTIKEATDIDKTGLESLQEKVKE